MIHLFNLLSSSIVKILFLNLSEIKYLLTMISLLHVCTELEFVKVRSAHRSQDKSVSILTGYGLDR
jgi:hypothetical protein